MRAPCATPLSGTLAAHDQLVLDVGPLVQPHRLMELLPCIAETSFDTMVRSIMTLSVAQARCRPGCINELQRVDEEMLLCPVKRAALAVLWASYNVQESGLSVASSLGEAAGLQERHQWGLSSPQCPGIPGHLSNCDCGEVSRLGPY